MVQADEGAREGDESEEDVLAFFLAHDEAAEAGHPGVCASHDTPVTAQVAAAVHAAARGAGQNGPFAARPATETRPDTLACLMVQPSATRLLLHEGRTTTLTPSYVSASQAVTHQP